MKQQKYHVWCFIDGLLWCPMTHRGKTEWTLRTAIRYAEEFSDTFKCRTKVLPIEEEITE